MSHPFTAQHWVKWKSPTAPFVWVGLESPWHFRDAFDQENGLCDCAISLPPFHLPMALEFTAQLQPQFLKDHKFLKVLHSYQYVRSGWVGAGGTPTGTPAEGKVPCLPWLVFFRRDEAVPHMEVMSGRETCRGCVVTEAFTAQRFIYGFIGGSETKRSFCSIDPELEEKEKQVLGANLVFVWQWVLRSPFCRRGQLLIPAVSFHCVTDAISSGSQY